jgi:midasin (ATPase involved in ribosome maturation)
MVLMNLEFAKALQMPCIIELQEAAAMDPGVTQKLHSIMDKRDNTFRLADGSIITRHPKCIIVATINPTYEGCRELNRAFLRRFNAKIELESMTHAQIKTILSAVCRKGISDELMDTIVNVFFKTESYIETSLKGRYDMALAEFQDWVIFVDHGIDPIKAAMQTFVPGLAELNGKIMTQIKQGILVPAFAK